MFLIDFLVCGFLNCGRVRFSESPQPAPFSIPRPNHCTHAWKPNLPECRDQKND